MAKRKKPGKAPKAAATGQILPATQVQLLDDLRSLTRQAREGVAQAVNSALVLLYWEIGHRIRTEVLKDQRAGYGEEIFSTLSKKLTTEFGSEPKRTEKVPGSDITIPIIRNIRSWHHSSAVLLTHCQTRTTQGPVAERHRAPYPASGHDRPSPARRSSGSSQGWSISDANRRPCGVSPYSPKLSASVLPHGMSWAAYQGFGPDHLALDRQGDTCRQPAPLVSIQLGNCFECIADVGLCFLQGIAFGKQFRQNRGSDCVATFWLGSEHQGNAVHHASYLQQKIASPN
jgi:hypothetical protein